MNTDYFPKKLYSHLDGSFDYFCGAYKAASYNFTISTQFEHISSSSSTNDVADEIFDQPAGDPSFDLKAKHFFSHILVGTLLLVPILNYFVFKGFESTDNSSMNNVPTPIPTIPDQTSHLPIPLELSSNEPIKLKTETDIKPSLDNLQTPTPTIQDQTSHLPISLELSSDEPIKLETETTVKPIELDGDDSPEEVPPELPKPALPRTNSNPRSRVIIEDTSHMKKLQRRNSKVSQRALIFEQNKLNHQQQVLDAALPVLDGERSNPVTIAEFKEIETSFTKDFFNLFPNETCDSKFASLRKRQEEESLGVVFNDSKYIESLFLNTEGFTPEVRFKKANENLAALHQFILDLYPHLKDNFYILANYKNDMQKKIEEIPYVKIIKILFRASLEEFLKELNNYKFVEIPAMEGEKVAVRIDTIEFQQTHKLPGTIKKKLKLYRNSASALK